MITTAFGRKLSYIVAMVGLLIPLFLLGQPPSHSGNSGTGNSGIQGGTLATLRDRYDIGQASLGQLDPASETMRLASLGLRGVAATILWQYADHFKEEKYWDLLSATLNQLALLQPHFVSVWESQAHNLAYNVSAEFDDYHERYAWVKKGMDFLVRGTQFNRRQPLLQWHLGKYTTLKLGRSDEHRQFRELFRDDEAFHKTLTGYGLDVDQLEARGSDRKPDNWLVGRLWFLKAYDLVRAGHYCKKNPFHFYAEAPWAQFYYAEAIEEEGVLDEKAMFAWSRASDSWTEYGNMDLMTTWGHTVQLRGLTQAREAADKASHKFSEFTKELLPILIEEGKSRLTSDELASIGKPEADRSPQEAEFASIAALKVSPSPSVIAQKTSREKRAEAIQLANELSEKNDFALHVDRSREMVNYRYWQARGEMEQTPTAVTARRQIYGAEKYLAEADLNKAVELYEVAWKNWDRILRKFPTMIHEESADALMRSITRYAESTDTVIEESFPLFWFYSYRGLRDKNQGSIDAGKRYQEYLDASLKYDGKLDEPFEIGPTKASQLAPQSEVKKRDMKSTEENATPAAKTGVVKGKSAVQVTAPSHQESQQLRPPALELPE